MTSDDDTYKKPNANVYKTHIAFYICDGRHMSFPLKRLHHITNTTHTHTHLKDIEVYANLVNGNGKALFQAAKIIKFPRTHPQTMRRISAERIRINDRALLN